MTYEYLSYILLWSSTIHYYIYIYEFLPVMRLLILGGFCYPKKVSTSIYKLFKLSMEGKNFYIQCANMIGFVEKPNSLKLMLRNGNQVHKATRFYIMGLL